MRDRNPTVLLVENDPADQALTRRAAQGGRFDLAIVDSGEQALDYLLGRGTREDDPGPRPGIVLLDLNLDVESGFDLLALIRKHEELQDLVVIVLTTSEWPNDVRRSYELGANSFITKPTRLASWKECLQSIERYWLDVATLPA